MAQPEIVDTPQATGAAANATNATATATLAAPGAAYKWMVTGWGASFSGAAVGTPVACTVTIGALVITMGVGTGGGSWWTELTNAIPALANGAPSIDLAAGGVGAVGRVYITGYKVPASY